MDRTPKLQSFPKSVFLNPMIFHNLENEYWLKKCSSHPEYKLLKPSEGEQSRPISSFSPQILREFHILLAEWRSEARELVACMREKERQSILASVGIHTFSEDVLSQKDKDISGDLNTKKMSQRNPCTSAVSWRNSSFVSGMRKRKSTQLIRGNRSSKFVRLSNYPQNSSWSRKNCYNNPLLKRRDINKTSIPTENLKRTTHIDNKSQYLDEDDDEEEDQLTAIVSRQRQAFSARAAAGRPSIRKIQSDLQAKSGDAALSTVSSVPAARRLSAKVLRAWKSLAKKIICKVARQRGTNRRDKIIIAKRAARECARLLRQKALISQKAARDSISRGHRLSREIASNWRSSTSSTANGSGPLTINGVTIPSSSNITHFSSLMDLPDYYTSARPESGGLELNMSNSMMESSTAIRRRAEKAAAEQRKADLELLEARRQQRKLNFLITQTELYAHFMAKKMADVNSGNCESKDICGPENSESVSGNVIQEEDSQEIEAQRILRRLEEMDDDSVETKTNDEGTDTGSDISVPCDPTQNDQDTVDSSTTTQIEAPKLFKGQLKAYQVRGLNWLLGLFDQGINGILADEMGLGKTVQTVAFLGCLAENYNIWGPFLIVTPASTLHNWTQEFAKFLPAFRLVPYWGTPTERKVLRRFWSSTRSSNVESVDESDSQLHVVITSYQVVLQDAKFINKTAWSYIVLDEAHAIKSTSSLRWKILLSFKCRNRLLLTGTPIQNTMQELWALLHFIMPTLFDSHDEFANWFSRDIESQASVTARTGGGGGSITSSSGTGSLITSKLNENQLSRLHLILKPFMLRRTKTEVEHEISTKTEIMLYCPLSHRQQVLYERLRSKIRLEDLSSIMSANGISDNFSSNLDNTNALSSSSSATAHLINLVMQLRKVCNHPDLWERRDVRFSCITGQIEPNSCRFYNSNIKYNAYNNNRNQYAMWKLPNLLYEDDSGKLTTLDYLLSELKSNGHRVLIYSQMTRMIDILEEFMLYRKHAYLRLDGSSRLSNRRDMVAQWQTNPRWFVFLLSTRAGGLGINLTAADTVIFYDSDWNPTVDQQAMDRAHRLGQTKPVTVYRLICKNTVEGRMLRRAEEKRAMQQMVIQSGQGGLNNLLSNVTNSSSSTEHMTSSDMVSLLLDDDELVKRLQIRRRLQPQRGRPAKNQAAKRLIASENVTNLSNADAEAHVIGRSSSSGFNPTKSSSRPQAASDISAVDEDLLERKRQAAWAEQPRGGRIKKIRPMESIGPATISPFDSSVTTCDNDNNSNSNSSNNTT
ncbi:helicase swr1, putative [Schistosoma mansoni]|uniref:helicase swr1, putative n=1 Tax=Schistosoma mansoni TaxID=6183 RepID=UPI00022C819F|nr:helicase swr1, putative [Schistosoma mansoni]|eukprot:XP_018645948.1 helicase swr1, putative [Schistosoma mansoni]